MFGSSGLLGMLYYGDFPLREHCTSLVDLVEFKVVTCIHTDSVVRRAEGEEGWLWFTEWGGGVFSLSLDGFFLLHCPDTRTKTAVESLLPRSLCSF